MIKLLSLEFGGIRSFVEDQVVDFEHRDKLIQIDGRNENTGGSSGAGKSSVAMALLYLFDLSDVPTTVLQTRIGKAGIRAKGRFLIDNVPVTISRSKKDGLTIEMPNETVSGNSKLAEEKLDQLIGLPRKIFKKMIFKKQKENGFFLSMTAQEMYKFLISVLGLEIYITNMTTMDADITKYTKEIEDKTIKIDLTTSSLRDMERILSEKKKPAPTVHPDEITTINTCITSLRNQKTALQDEIKQAVEAIPKVQESVADLTEIHSKIAALVPTRTALTEKLASLDTPTKILETQINAIPYAVRDAQKAGSEITRIRTDKEHIEKSQCPTCLQTWVGDTAATKIQTMNTQIQELITVALNHKKVIDSKPELEANLNRLKEIRQGVEGEVAALQEKRAALDAEKYRLMEEVSKKNEAARNAYTVQKNEVESKFKANIDTLNEELKKLEIDLSAKESQHNSYIVAAKQYKDEVDSLMALVLKKTDELTVLQNSLIDLKKKIIVAEESKRMIKAYVLQMFQETLDAIGVSATNILAGIPNMSTSTIYFEGCKENKNGSIRDEIVAIINMNGENEIPIKSLSGGEETTTHLGVDLAVIDVIETKVGKGADFFFMDEPFDGLDAVCKENCLEILKQLDTNKKIIMVDHSSELKEMVSDVILVVKKGETSSIQV